MEILWHHGEGSPEDVREKLGRDLAYTTVMTTLKRLHTKGWANRRMVRRAFQYTPRVSRRELDTACAEHFLSEYLAEPHRLSPMLITLFVDLAGAINPKLLDELERKIAVKRLEMLGDTETAPK